jgi:hypothetical protein
MQPKYTLAIALAFLIVISAPAQGALVRIYATHEETPIPGVEIRMVNTANGDTTTATTHTNGTALFNVPAGSYEISASHPDYTANPKIIQTDDTTTSTTLDMNKNEEETSWTAFSIFMIIGAATGIIMFIFWVTSQKDMILGIFNSSSATEFAKSEDKDERAAGFLTKLMGGGQL